MDILIRIITVHYRKAFLVLLFCSICVILLFPVSRLQMNMDDHVHIYPALLGDYPDHFQGYTHDYGLLRPLALIWFYIIYTIYLVSPVIAHSIPFLFHIAAGYCLYKILHNHLSFGLSVLIGIAFIVFPFFTEQYGWLAASNASIANFILIIQLYILTIPTWSFKKKLIALFGLQSVGVLLYESVFFTFIALAYLLAHEYAVNWRSKKFVLSLSLLSAPSLVYVLLRALVFTPRTNFAREMSIRYLLTENGSVQIFDNVRMFIDNLSFLFFTEVMHQSYWIGNIATGYEQFSQSPLLVLGVNYFIIGCLALIFLSRVKQESTHWSTDIRSYLLLSLLVLLPGLLLSSPAFPFRVLALPLFFLFIGIIVLISKLNQTVAAILLSIAITLSVFISISILHQMTLQAVDDDTGFIMIVEGVNNNLSPNEKAIVVIEGVPNSTRTNVSFGQYLSSCMSADWCMQAGINRRTPNISRIIVNPSEEVPISESDRVFFFQYDPATRRMIMQDI
jgi:hypothetical protein